MPVIMVHGRPETILSNEDIIHLIRRDMGDEVTDLLLDKRAECRENVCDSCSSVSEMNDAIQDAIYALEAALR